MNIGIVILNYNDSKTTIELLNRIKNFNILNSIVVVDNNSTDDSYEKLLNYASDKIIVIKAENNKGYGYGNNIGCRYLIQNNVDYIIISNPDVIFEEGDIIKLIKSFDEKTAIVAPTIKEGESLNRGWKYPSAFIDAMSNINFIGRKFKQKLLYDNDYYRNDCAKVDVVSGCFFIIDKDVFIETNGFDQNVFLYYEESILSKKINNINKDIIVNNNVEVIHNHSVSVDKSINKIKKFKNLAKSQRYYHRNYNNANILQMIILYISYIVTLTISYILSIKNEKRKC